jgi:tellurite methyltransferase
MNGGYDGGYRACNCFWGTEPGSFVRLLQAHVRDFSGLRAVDLGCGEGKNAVFLATQGAVVDAIDISECAIGNGMRQWPTVSGVKWQVDDIRHVPLAARAYDVAIAYGVLHCLDDETEVRLVMHRLKEAIRPSGHMVVCTFNDRRQELSVAHPGFYPCLLSHAEYLSMLSGFEIIATSDSDLTERHPHNNIEHTHSLSRILARKENG